MDNDDMRKDFNMKSILKIRRIMAPILKALIKEYEDVTVEEIAEEYLPKSGEEIELLNTEQVGLNEISTRYDLLFVAKTPKKFGYNLIIDFEVQVTDQGLAFVVRKIIYMGKLFTRQDYKLDELKEEAKQQDKRYIDLYRNLDHPVLISFEWGNKGGRGNKIVHTELNPVVFEYSDGLLGKIEKGKELKALPSEIKGFGLEEFITVYIDEDVKDPKGLFKLLSEGIFNMTKSKEDRIKIIEEFTGPLKKGAIEVLDTEWGTAEYFEKRGEKRGEKKNIEKFIKLFKEEGMTEEEIQMLLKKGGFVSD